MSNLFLFLYFQKQTSKLTKKQKQKNTHIHTYTQKNKSTKHKIGNRNTKGEDLRAMVVHAFNPALGKQRQEMLCEFEATPVHKTKFQYRQRYCTDISVSNSQKRTKNISKLPLSLILTACLIILKGLHYFKNVILFQVAFYVVFTNSLLELCDNIHVIYILFSQLPLIFFFP